MGPIERPSLCLRTCSETESSPFCWVHLRTNQLRTETEFGLSNVHNVQNCDSYRPISVWNNLRRRSLFFLANQCLSESTKHNNSLFNKAFTCFSQCWTSSESKISSTQEMLYVYDRDVSSVELVLLPDDVQQWPKHVKAL
jgi:hypothetical protein